jgi:uncharacterized damage-inducible protein DinB
MRDTLQSLAAHMRWADQRTIAGYRTLPDGRADALRWIGHIAGSEHMWLSRIAGMEARLAVWPDLDIARCERAMGENHDALDRLLATADEGTLTRVVRYVNSKGDMYESQVHDILVHMAMHGQYHRGQVAAAVRAAGGEPTATDYIVWRRGDPVR